LKLEFRGKNFEVVQFSKAAAASSFILSPQDFISPVNKSTTMKYGIGHK